MSTKTNQSIFIVLERHEYEEDSIVGAFLSVEDAKKLIKQLNEKKRFPYRFVILEYRGAEYISHREL